MHHLVICLLWQLLDFLLYVCAVRYQDPKETEKDWLCSTLKKTKMQERRFLKHFQTKFYNFLKNRRKISERDEDERSAS